MATTFWKLVTVAESGRESDMGSLNLLGSESEPPPWFAMGQVIEHPPGTSWKVFSFTKTGDDDGAIYLKPVAH